MEKALKKISELAVSLGIPSFVLMIRNKEVNTFHYENIKLGDVMNLTIAGFINVINMEVEKHPEYSHERKTLYGSLASDFTKLVKDYDKKINDCMVRDGEKK